MRTDPSVCFDTSTTCPQSPAKNSYCATPLPHPAGNGLSQLENSLSLVKSFFVSESLVSISCLNVKGSFFALTASSSMKHSCAKARVELVTDLQAEIGT